MPQQTDVVLDGAGYMLVPGHYTRAQDGAPEGRTGRISFRDFFGGLRRHVQLERDRAFSGLTVGPALNGQGVQPWGRIVVGAAAPTYAVLPDENVKIPSVVCRERVYFAIGAEVFETVANGSGWSAPTLKVNTTATVKDMCLYASTGFLCTFGAAKDVTWYRASDAASTVLLAGEQGHWITNFGGYAMWNDARAAGREVYLRQVTGTNIDLRILDYDVIGMFTADARAYAITKQALYAYNGRVHTIKIPNPAYSSIGAEPLTVDSLQWTGDWTPFFQHGVAALKDDYRVFEGFGGRIHTWLAGQMMEFNPDGERAGWRATGLSGVRCFGGCVAAGYLVVSIESVEGNNELWAWDGSGWWCTGRKAMATTGHWIWPTNLNNAGSRDVLLFRHGEQGLDLLRLQHRAGANHAFATSGDISTPMIDAGERDRDKAWRKVGAVFATPERNGTLASADAVTVYLDYSIDGGASWTQAVGATRTGNSLASANFTLEAGLASPVSRFVMLRVRWLSVADWAPALVGLWCEFEVMDSPARRRKWQFRVMARDQAVDRDGAVLTRTGRELIAELWAKWQAGAVLAFRDLDYDTAVIERSVRIVGISESVAKPGDQGRWGDAVVSLHLVEL